MDRSHRPALVALAVKRDEHAIRLLADHLTEFPAETAELLSILRRLAGLPNKEGMTLADLFRSVNPGRIRPYVHRIANALLYTFRQKGIPLEGGPENVAARIRADDIVKLSPADLLEAPNFGRVSLDVLRVMLRLNGLALRGDPLPSASPVRWQAAAMALMREQEGNQTTLTDTALLVQLVSAVDEVVRLGPWAVGQLTSSIHEWVARLRQGREMPSEGVQTGQ